MVTRGRGKKGGMYVRIEAEAPGVRETVLEVLIGFLKGQDIGAPAPLVARHGVLESYGVPIARIEGNNRDKVVRLLEIGPEEMTPVRRRHRIQLKVLAQEQGLTVEGV